MPTTQGNKQKINAAESAIFTAWALTRFRGPLPAYRRGMFRRQAEGPASASNVEPHPGLFYQAAAPLREYVEVLGVIAAITGIAWFVPLDYRVFGDVYLVAVIVLCLRVSSWPILFASVISVLAWNLVIVPPRLSFSHLQLKDGVFLGTYFVAALIGGQLTARIRSQERRERQREQRATALFHLTRALSSAHTRDEALTAALRQADVLFAAHTALLLPGGRDNLVSHSASSLQLQPFELGQAHTVARTAAQPRTMQGTGSDSALHFPLLRGGKVVGVFSIGDWS